MSGYKMTAGTYVWLRPDPMLGVPKRAGFRRWVVLEHLDLGGTFEDYLHKVEPHTFTSKRKAVWFYESVLWPTVLDPHHRVGADHDDYWALKAAVETRTGV